MKAVSRVIRLEEAERASRAPGSRTPVKLLNRGRPATHRRASHSYMVRSSFNLSFSIVFALSSRKTKPLKFLESSLD